MKKPSSNLINQITPNSIHTTIAMLEENPYLIAKLVQKIKPESLQVKPEKNAWSAVEIMAHLRSCADIWGAEHSRNVDN